MNTSSEQIMTKIIFHALSKNNRVRKSKQREAAYIFMRELYLRKFTKKKAIEDSARNNSERTPVRIKTKGKGVLPSASDNFGILIVNK